MRNEFLFTLLSTKQQGCGVVSGFGALGCVGGVGKVVSAHHGVAKHGQPSQVRCYRRWPDLVVPLAISVWEIAKFGTQMPHTTWPNRVMPDHKCCIPRGQIEPCPTISGRIHDRIQPRELQDGLPSSRFGLNNHCWCNCRRRG